jgi:general secretion pathway protein L
MDVAHKLHDLKFMPFFNTSLGIDFKTNHLILTLLRKSFRKIHLLDYRIYPLWTEGQKEVQEAQWISLITTFISKNAVDGERVCVSIPREKVLVRFLRLPIATKENLKKVLEYEAPKLIPFDKEDFCFDFQILREDGEWVYLIAAFVKNEDLKPYLTLLKKMGIQPISIQIPAVSALNLFFFHEGNKGNEVSVLLDLNEPFYEMNILEGENWKDSFHLPTPQENKEGSILQAFKRSDLKEESLSKAMFYVYGLDATEKAMPDFEKTDGMKGVASPPTHRIEAGVDESLPDHVYPSIGLPLMGLTETHFKLNLLPLELRKKVREYGKPIFLAFLSLAFILSLAWGGGVYNRYRNELEILRAEVKKKKPEMEAVEKLQKKRSELTAAITEFDKITRGAVSEVEILKELAQVLPPTVWIWQYRISGKEIEISGFADSASELIPLLDKSPLFEKVEFQAPVTKERERRIGVDKERERFKIKMRLEGMGGA